MPKTHDALCPIRTWHRMYFQFCHCALIRKVRADERVKLAAVDVLEQARASERGRLRAEVAVLHNVDRSRLGTFGRGWTGALQEVLDLLDSPAPE